MHNFRIFLSSPGDVAEERREAHQILTVLPEEPAWRGRISIEVARWDNPHSPTPMYANFSPQDAVNLHLPKPSECELVILILWSRFGTSLTNPLKADNTQYLSGTEWEYEDAVQARVPVLLFRRTSEPYVPLRDREYAEKSRQFELVEKFFERFSSPTGSSGGVIPYDNLSDFKDKFGHVVEGAIRQFIERTTAAHRSLSDIVERLTLSLKETEAKIDKLTSELIVLRSSHARPEPLPADPHDHPDPTAHLGSVPATAINILSTGVKLNVTRLDRNELRALSRDPEVASVAKVIPMKLISPFVAQFPDTLPTATWSVNAVGADTSPFTGEGVTVAILDTGIDLSHPAFAGVNFTARDFTGDDNYTDTNGHGTHFAGSVLGRPVDGLRFGVAPGIKKALIAKTIGSRGGSSSAFLSALLWAVEQGADIIALAAQFDLVGLERNYRESIGLGAETGLARTLDDVRANAQLFEKAIAFMGQSEVFGHPTIIAAAGNESRRDLGIVAGVSSPANSPGILSVASVGQILGNLTISPFSSVGAEVCSPGEAVVSAKVGGGLASFSGSSMAAAHAVGVAALWLEKLRRERRASPGLLRAQMLATATVQGFRPGYERFDVGNGILRAPES